MDTQQFFFGMNSVCIEDYYTIRKEIIEQCNISRVTFRYWYNGKYIPSVKYQHIIDRIMKNYKYQPIYNKEDNNNENREPC